MLGPLAGLLLLSRPASLREWLWVALSAGIAVLTLMHPSGLPDQFVRSAIVVLTGAFLAMAVARPGPFFPRALAALGLAAAVLAVYCAWYGIGWGELVAASRQQAQAVGRMLVEQARAGARDAGSVAAARAEDTATQIAHSIESLAPLFPGQLALAGLAGLAVAWALHQRVARRPLGPPLGRLADFRFNDHLVWVFVLALALCLAPLGPAARPIGLNLLYVGLVLYGLRGLAVFWSSMRRAPCGVRVALAIAALLLSTFIAAGLVLLGLADTWVDFRRRVPSSPTGGSDR